MSAGALRGWVKARTGSNKGLTGSLIHPTSSSAGIAADCCSGTPSSRQRLQPIFVVESTQNRHGDHAVIRGDLMAVWRRERVLRRGRNAWAEARMGTP